MNFVHRDASFATLAHSGCAMCSFLGLNDGLLIRIAYTFKVLLDVKDK